jgi:predicted DCC family thiol-disulfide oxidoreductase YuxK
MLNDGDCGFCMRTAAWVPRLGVDIDSATIQAVDLPALGVDADRAVVEMPYVHPDGRVDYGHRAFAAILRTGPLPWRLVGRLMTAPGIDAVARRTYHWIAANRSRLPGGTPACSIDGS